jgi:alpha-N-acetylglucosamine transferase
MNAFVLIHFGSNIKYLELELYFLNMLKKNTNNDIIYLYSINDTPYTFINIIKTNYSFVKIISYNDNNITYNITNFNSYYKHFNTLRTCNFIFAYTLIEYDKICIIESDMVIMSNIDEIFQLKTPSILYYNSDSKIDKIYRIKVKSDNIIKTCSTGSKVNGGVILFKPSIKKFNRLIENMSIIIENECKYPNESLFLYTFNKFYNLPIRYNCSHYKLNLLNDKINVLIYHFNETEYKPLNIIKDNYIHKVKKNKIHIIKYFKKKYYDKYYQKINKLLNL